MRRHPRPASRTRSPAPADDAEARYRALTEMLPLVTYVAALDVQGAITRISPQVEALLGFPPEDWLSGPGFWLSRLHPDDRGRVLPLLVRAHRGAAPFVAEYRLLGRDGKARWVRDESRAVRDEGGKPRFIMGTWTEITGLKSAEREAEGQERRLASSQAELAQFVSVAAHELAAPLRRIVNLGELLERRAAGSLDAESRALLGRMTRAAGRMGELLAGLVRYSEWGGAAVNAAAVDAGAALDRALAELGEGRAEAVTRGRLPAVWADAVLLERVWANLLDNAFKFKGPLPPAVHVSAAREAGDWVFSVRDNGIGIHPRAAQRVFGIFDREDPHGPRPGVGLGLAVCKKLLERMGGRIWVESDPGEGSTFRFTLPAPPDGGQP
jgi:PAS domain S-box-containing protein